MTVLAGTPGLDDFGLDGRPWARSDGGISDSGHGAPSKFLLDQGPAFIAAAKSHGRNSLALIENHALSRPDTTLMEQRLGAVLAQGYDHLMGRGERIEVRNAWSELRVYAESPEGHLWPGDAEDEALPANEPRIPQPAR